MIFWLSLYGLIIIASRSDLFPLVPSKVLFAWSVDCVRHTVLARLQCVFTIHTQNTVDLLYVNCSKKVGRGWALQLGASTLFCFYLPESSLLQLTIKWQIFHNGWCPYIQLIKVSFGEKGSHTESFCCRLYIFCNIWKHLAVWIFLVGLFDLLPCCKYNGEEKNQKYLFSLSYLRE